MAKFKKGDIVQHIDGSIYVVEQYIEGPSPQVRMAGTIIETYYGIKTPIRREYTGGPAANFVTLAEAEP